MQNGFDFEAGNHQQYIYSGARINLSVDLQQFSVIWARFCVVWRSRGTCNLLVATEHRL